MLVSPCAGSRQTAHTMTLLGIPGAGVEARRGFLDRLPVMRASDLETRVQYGYAVFGSACGIRG